MILTFTTGLVAKVPVVGRDFYYVTAMPLPDGAFLRNVIGVTENGQVITYELNKFK